MGRQVEFEVFFRESEKTRALERVATNDTHVLAEKVKKAVDSAESWPIIPIDLFEHTCKYLRLSDIIALGSTHSYFAHLILGRKKTVEEPLGDPCHPFIVPNAYKTHLEMRNTVKTPLNYRQYQRLVDVYLRFQQPLEPSLKVGYLDLGEADIDDVTLRQILKAFPRPLLLNLRNNPKLSDLTPLVNCTALQYLDLNGCTGLTELGPLSNCKSLRHLYLEGCARITDLTPIASYTYLQKLQIGGTGVFSLEPLSQIFSLKSLNCKGCLQIPINQMEHLRQLRSLEELYLPIQMTDLSIDLLSNFFFLRHLALYDCARLSDGGLIPLVRLPHLRSLLLGSARQITDQGLNHLGEIESLEDLTVVDCGAITDFGLLALMSLPALENLTIGPSHQITQIGLNFLKRQKQLAWRLVSR